MTKIAVVIIVAIIATIGLYGRPLHWFVLINLLSSAIRIAGPSDFNVIYPHTNMILLAVNLVCAVILVQRFVNHITKKSRK